MAKKVLVVDDEKDILKIVSFRVSSMGHNVTTAVNGREALDLIYKEKFDLIMLDLRMPIIDGYEVCRTIKNDEKYKNIPVILLTASSIGKIEERTKDYKADGYLIKPFVWEELQEKVNEFLT
ncbi:MAG: response regulator [Candidatus Omnitrophota bacterium]